MEFINYKYLFIGVVICMSSTSIAMMLNQQSLDQQLLEAVKRTDQEPASNPAHVSKLIEKGANVDAHDCADGATPLILEIRKSDAFEYNPATVQELLKNRANINAHDANGDTPLHWAVQSDNVRALRLLLTLSVDTSARNNNGLSAFDFYTQGKGGHLCGADIEEALKNRARNKLKEAAYSRQPQHFVKTVNEANALMAEHEKAKLASYDVRALKCTDGYTPMGHLMQRAGLQMQYSNKEYLNCIPYYPEDYYYEFFRITLFRTPSIDSVAFLRHAGAPLPYVGQISVFIPIGEPDPEIIREPFGIITGLAVVKEHQRKGHGRRLLKEALHQIRSRGLVKAVIRVDKGEENQTALSLYVSEGFTRDRDQNSFILSKTL